MINFRKSSLLFITFLIIKNLCASCTDNSDFLSDIIDMDPSFFSQNSFAEEDSGDNKRSLPTSFTNSTNLYFRFDQDIGNNSLKIFKEDTANSNVFCFSQDPLVLQNSNDDNKDFSSSSTSSPNVIMESEVKRKREIETSENSEKKPKKVTAEKKIQMKWDENSINRLEELYTELEPEFKFKKDIFKAIAKKLEEEFNANCTERSVKNRWGMIDKDKKKFFWNPEMKKRLQGLLNEEIPLTEMIEFLKLEFNVPLTEKTIQPQIKSLKEDPNFLTAKSLIKWTLTINDKLFALYNKLENKYENKNDIYVEISEKLTQEFKKEFTINAVKIQYNLLKKIENLTSDKKESRNSFQLDKIKEMISNLLSKNYSDTNIAEKIKETFKILASLESIQKWISVLKEELNILIPFTPSNNIKEIGIEERLITAPQNIEKQNENNNIITPFAKDPKQNMNDGNGQNNFSFEGFF